jgi:hypothetical protein
LAGAERNSHHECQPATLGGCDRCRPLPLTNCCDLCSPDAFERFSVAPPADTTRGRTKYGLNPKWKPTPQDDELADALHEYRKAVTLEKFKTLEYGASFWMPESVYDRILGLAHYRKLKSADDLAFELSDWPARDITGHGAKILALTNQHIPQEEPAVVSKDNSVPKTPAAITCSTCTAKNLPAAGHRCEQVSDIHGIIYLSLRFR